MGDDDPGLHRRLEALGVDAAAIDRAAAEGQLVRLAAERVLGDDARLTAEEIAVTSGLDAEIFLAHMAALGRPRAAPDERAFSEDDLEAARRIQTFRDLGLPDEGLLDQARIFRPALHHIAEAMLALIIETALRDVRSETEFAVALAELAEGLAPLGEPLLGYVLRIYVRQGLRQAVVREGDLAAGHLPHTEEVTVCFADLAGFTELGEDDDPRRITRITDRFTELAVAASGSRVRLVKMLGDAAMLVARDTEAVLDTSIELVEEAAREGGDFPPVHAGLARGAAVPRGGDWYGSPVNRASRITGVARAGEVVADTGVQAVTSDRPWHVLGEHQLKGVADSVTLFALRPAG